MIICVDHRRGGTVYLGHLKNLLEISEIKDFKDNYSVMGCDFDIIIQALHGTQWVSVITFYIKTRCGGYPLADAVWKLADKDGIRGTYGNNYRVSEVVGLEALLPSNLELWKVEQVETKHEKSIQKESNEGESEMEEEYSPTYLFYSLDNFLQIIQYLDVSEVERGYEKYKDDLSNIPTWVEAAKSALPITGTQYDWERESVDGLLLKSHNELKTEYTAFLQNIFRSTRLNENLIDHIAEYAVPYASDVRIAWNDDEGHTELIERGEAKPPNRCCIQ